MEKFNSGVFVQYVFFDSIRHAVKRVNTGLTNPLLFYADRIELLKAWRKESPNWLYTQPNSVFDSDIQAFEDYEAFAEEIKSNRRLKDNEDRQDYFHELKQFYNGDLRVLTQCIIEQINEVSSDIEKISEREPDQYAAGRPIMEVPKGKGPKARQQVFELHKIELENWRNTPQGKYAEQSYDHWKDKLRPLRDYQELLFKAQADIHQIDKIILNALPSSLAYLPHAERHVSSSNEITSDPQNNQLENIKPSVYVVAALCYYMEPAGVLKFQSRADYIKTVLIPLFGFTFSSISNKCSQMKDPNTRKRKVGAIEKAIEIMTNTEEFNYYNAILQAKTDVAINKNKS